MRALAGWIDDEGGSAFGCRRVTQSVRETLSAGGRASNRHPMREEGLFKRERAVGYGMAVARTRYPEIADALGFDRITRFASGQLALTKLAEALGLPKLLPGLLERNARRRLGLRRAFLEGALEAMRETGGGAA